MLSNSRQIKTVNKAIKSKRKKSNRKAIELPMPSGESWLILPVRLEQFFISGQLPFYLASKLKSLSDAEAAEISSEQIERLTLSMLDLARDVMFNNVIYPRITLTETDESITPEQIDPEDLSVFFDYIRNGAQIQDIKKNRAIYTMLEDEQSLLNFALICRESRRNFSEQLKIDDELTAFAFDSVCSHLCKTHDNKVAAERIKAQLGGLAAMFGGKSTGGDPGNADTEEY